MYDCIGFLELTSIAKGIETTDALFKKANVSLIFSRPISSGKYLVFFEGEVEEVSSAFIRAKEIAGRHLLDSVQIPQLHPQIRNGLEKVPSVEIKEALGILETSTCTSCMASLDTALKTDKVELVRVCLGQGIGGKAYWVIEGKVEDVDTSLLASTRVIKKEHILERVLIPYATQDLLTIFTAK